jgi:hypothetical protein
MPASGLNGGVGRVTLPTLRPCLPRYTPTPWPRACAGNSAKLNSRTHAVINLVMCVLDTKNPSSAPPPRRQATDMPVILKGEF